MPITVGKPAHRSQASGFAALGKNLGSYLFWLGVLAGCLGMGQAQTRVSDKPGFVGSHRCLQCHKEIAEVQLDTGHPRTLRRVRSIPELLQSVPVEYSDPKNQVLYRIERSPNKDFTLDLVASRAGETDRLHLLWGMGAGRKGITFVGMTGSGSYGQSRVSWYQRTGGLDITTGLEARVDNAHDALADWMSPPQREHCFACHTTRDAAVPPERMDPANAGVQCERCHGPGKGHIEAMTLGKVDPASTIGNPGRMPAIEQLYFCGACHGAPPGGTDVQTISKYMIDKRVTRFPAQRLVLSECYSESQGQLKCTTCHDPHQNLARSAKHYDPKCLACHGSHQESMGPSCPVGTSECSSCHMPFEEGFMTHSEFADHWIRIAVTRKP